jgi:hypothetical protein
MSGKKASVESENITVDRFIRFLGSSTFSASERRSRTPNYVTGTTLQIANAATKLNFKLDQLLGPSTDIRGYFVHLTGAAANFLGEFNEQV